MRPGEVGHVVRFETERAILPGGSCTILVTRPDGSQERLFALPAPDGMSCTRTTTPTDFPIPGRYTIVVDADLVDGTDDYSLPIQLDVGTPPPK